MREEVATAVVNVIPVVVTLSEGTTIVFDVTEVMG
jgi:hypothetical protein